MNTSARSFVIFASRVLAIGGMTTILGANPAYGESPRQCKTVQKENCARLEQEREERPHLERPRPKDSGKPGRLRERPPTPYDNRHSYA